MVWSGSLVETASEIQIDMSTMTMEYIIIASIYCTVDSTSGLTHGPLYSQLRSSRDMNVEKNAPIDVCRTTLAIHLMGKFRLN